MKKFVRTTCYVTFRNNEVHDLPENVTYEGNQVGPGFICSVVHERGDTGAVIIQSVKYPAWIAEVDPHHIEEIPAMEFLAEVHAGNIPDEALEESPCE